MAKNEDPARKKGRKVKRHGEPRDEQRQPQPGTEGPDGQLDDQPQREDEYLSDMLNEFNPQRKDEQKPVSDTKAATEIRHDQTDDGRPSGDT